MKTPLTPEEIAAIKKGQHPLSDEALAWADQQIGEIEAQRGTMDVSSFKTFAEFKASVLKRFPHLR